MDADKIFAEVLHLAGETEGWKVTKDGNGAVLSEKGVEGSALNMFRVVAVVPHPPKKVIDTLWSWGLAEWKEYDPDVKEWRVVQQIDDNTRVLYQVNSLPWPLWARDTCLTQARREKDGTFALLLKSTSHADAPEKPKDYVRAQVLTSAFIFAPEGADKTKFIRIVHVDPSGNIPSSVVNSSAKQLHEAPAKLSKFIK
eukprot:TRINITY_DN3026_c0_g1_i1.p1 TRINITY_DN3026_c0_g1~~TRINITY_DN3026_c0_g1_i1.p1  ORF type:complete len:198 (-),score=74.63 TRINITY_DN3026_c0_g1_i1:58-651(-)